MKRSEAEWALSIRPEGVLTPNEASETEDMTRDGIEELGRQVTKTLSC